jgi:tetratricopeptide (TPR) repeat protein
LALGSQTHSRLEDPGAELLDKLSGFWQRYGRFALAGLGLVAVVGLAAFFTMRTRSANEDRAARRLAEASVLFWQGEYARSADIAKQVVDQFPGTASALDAHRISGDDAFWTQDYAGAIREYRAFLDKARPGTLTEAVRRSYAYALENNRQYKDAAEVFESLVGRFDREASGEFLSASARCYRALQQPAEALKRYHRVVDEFGETSYAAMARIAIGELSSVK